MCLFLTLPWSWSDHFSLSVHLQWVCAYSWPFHEIDLTISPCLPIFRGYVLVLDPSMKSIWAFLLVCSFSAGMCLFLTLFMTLTWPFFPVCPFSAGNACSWPFHEVDLTVCPFSVGMCLFLILPWSWPDLFSLSAHLQWVCASWSFHEVDLTISFCLPIFRGYVLVLDPSIKSIWPFLFVCPSSGGMCLFLTLPWSQSDHFFLSTHLQGVCACSWPFHEVDLTISPCLLIFSRYVPVLDPFMKSTWPFLLVCPSLAGMCLFLILPWSWPDPFSLSAHLQEVCACFWPFHKVDLTIFSCLPIFSGYVLVLNHSMKLTWLFLLICPFSGGMCLFLTLLWSWPDHFSLFSHPQRVCACCWLPFHEVDLTISPCLSISGYVLDPFHEVDLTISPCLPIFRRYVLVLDPFHEVDLIISLCLFIFRRYVLVLDPSMKLTWSFLFVCSSSGGMCLFLILPWCWPGHFSLSAHLQRICACSWPFPWKWPDHFFLSAHFQRVCAYSWSFHEVDLTIFSCLPIFSGYVLALDFSMKLTWPFLFVCPFSAGMCLFLTHEVDLTISLLSAYLQNVCVCSWCFHDIDLIISPCLSIFSLYVIVCVFLITWANHICIFLESMSCSANICEIDVVIWS